MGPTSVVGRIKISDTLTRGARGRGYVDDVAPALRAHATDHGAACMQGGEQVDLDHTAPLGGVRILNAAWLNDSGRIHQNVDSTESFQRLAHHVLRNGLIGSVAGQRDGRPAGRRDLVRQSSQATGAAGRERNRCAGCSQRERRAFADARR
jgi:hypothetical protein